jgi:hypothetical protein
MEEDPRPATDDSIDNTRRDTSAIEICGDETFQDAIPADTEDLVAELKEILAQAKVIGASPASLQRAFMLADTLSERLASCPICYQTLADPKTTPRGHIFCRVCLDTWLSRSSSCPACRQTIWPTIPPTIPPVIQPFTANSDIAHLHVVMSDAMLGPYRLRLQNLLASILPPPANTGGGGGDEGRVREDISSEAGAWLEHHYANISDNLHHTAVRPNLHATIIVNGDGVSESVKLRARQHLTSLMDGK